MIGLPFTVSLMLCALRLALCAKGAAQSRACRAAASVKAGPLGPDSLLGRVRRLVKRRAGRTAYSAMRAGQADAN
jgi:hypothetical protein